MLYFIMGATGAGKTTYALQLSRQLGAPYFAVDQWMKLLYLPDLTGEISFEWAIERVTRCEDMIWEISAQMHRLGMPVVLELGMTTREMRHRHRARAANIKADYQIHFLDAPADLRWRRVQRRNEQQGESYSFPVDRSMFDFVERQWEYPSQEELVGMLRITESQSVSV